MQTTNNLNLKKPEVSDVVDVDDFNSNADILDAEVTRLASTTQPGRMSAADKTKLNGIAAGANNYTHPANHPPSIITQDANNRFMTDAERNKLAGVAAGAQVNTVTAVAGKTGSVALAKGDVGLGSVENYPIATQVQAQAGTHTASYMTPQRVAQAIATQAPAPADGSITDAKIGNRTITDTSAPTGNSGTLTSLLGWLGNMIRSITGKANWRTAPATTLEAANTHHNATSAHSATSAATANRIMMRDASGRARVAQPSHNDDIANKQYVDLGLSDHVAAADPHNQYTQKDGADSVAISNTYPFLNLIATDDPSATRGLRIINYNGEVSLQVIGNDSAWQRNLISFNKSTGEATIAGAVNWQQHKITEAGGASLSLSSGTDLNTVIKSGFYRLQENHINGPSVSVNYSQMIVSSNLDTICQTIYRWGGSEVYYRTGTISGNWFTWKRILNQDDYNTLFQFANDGKTAVANAVTAKGVSASPSDTFATLASKVGQIVTGIQRHQQIIPAPISITAINAETHIATITGLGFIPTLAVIYCTGNATVNGTGNTSGVTISSIGYASVRVAQTIRLRLRVANATVNSVDVLIERESGSNTMYIASGTNTLHLIE